MMGFCILWFYFSLLPLPQGSPDEFVFIDFFPPLFEILIYLETFECLQNLWISKESLFGFKSIIVLESEMMSRSGL